MLPLSAKLERAIGAEFDRLIAIVMREVTPLLIALGVRRDAVTLSELFGALQSEPNPEPQLRRLFEQVNREEAAALRRQLPTVELPSVVSNGARLQETWVRRNTDLIKAKPAVQRAIKKVLDQPLTEGVRVEQIRKQLQERMGLEKRRAQLIARDQTLKLAGQLAQARQTQAGVRRYVWTTSADERVREDHAKLDGQIISWDDPPIVDQRTGRRAHAGFDFQCRCTSDPILDDLEKDPEAEPAPVAPSPPEPELEATFPPEREPLRGFARSEVPPAIAPAAPSELLERAEFEVSRGLRGSAAAEAEAAIARALPGKTLEDLRAIPFTATELAGDESLAWLRQSAFFAQTGNVPDNFGHSRGGLPQITIEADGKVYLSNGRHRLTVARELGLRQIQVRLRKLGPRGGLLWTYVGLLRI